MSKMTMSPSAPVYLYRGGIVFLVFLIVILMYGRQTSFCEKDTVPVNVHYNENRLSRGSIHVSTKGLFEENKKPALMAKEFNPERFSQKKSPDFDFRKEIANLIKSNVRADDPKLINLVRNYFIEQPSTEPYNLEKPDQLEFSAGQTPLVDSRMKYVEGGFYVECGALNGETSSTSLFLERVRKWNGLLIEADPSNYALLKSKKRKAFTVNACLSISESPSKVTFNKAFQRGRIMQDKESKKWIQGQGLPQDAVQIECFPFYSFMLALNRTTIDFFSLDVEGDEMKILKTIPFDKLNIKMLTVEYLHMPGGESALKSFMEGKGYSEVANVRHGYSVGDIIFIKKKIL